MLFLIIGLIAFILGTILAGKGNFNIPLLLIAAMFTTLGITPISGYEEPVLLNEYELECISEPEIYVIMDENDSIVCKHDKETNSSEQEIYKTYNYDENVEFVFIEKGSQPVVKYYELKAQKTLFTVALKCDKMKYVFYIPEENIEKWEKERIN